MRLAIAMLLATLTTGSAEATWGWRWGNGYGYGYSQPQFYQPRYYAPSYSYVPSWCECPPVMAAPLTPSVNPPKPMPEKKVGGTTPEGVPYSPIVPAAGTEEKIPKPEVPLPKVEPTPPPKVEFKPAALPKPEAPKIDFPSITPTAPDLKLPPLPVPEKTTSKYGTALDVKMIAVAGTPAGEKYQIDFRNYSDHEVDVMVDGSRITLPAKHVTTARVRASSRWSLEGGSVAFGAIPPGHRGGR